jgi:DNA mismatch repair protein MutS
VQVAKLAGVPPAVVARARQVLDRLENEAAAQYDLAELPLFAAVAQPSAPAYRGPGPLETALAQLDLDGMSPREAMEALYRLKGLAGA